MNDSIARILAGLSLIGVVGLLISHVSLRGEVAELRGQNQASSPGVETNPIQAPLATAPIAAVPAATKPPAQKSKAPKWVCKGVLPIDHVGQRLAKQAPGVLACIATATQEDPALKGRLQVVLKVDKTGKTDEVNVSGVDHKGLVDCAGKAALRWSFDPPQGLDCAVVAAPFRVGP